MAEPIKPGEFYRIRDDGKWEIYGDATMFFTFGACEQMFKYAFVDSKTPKGDRPFVRDLGSWWSEVMENIYTAFAKGTQMPLTDIPKLAMQVWTKLNMDELEKLQPKKWKEFGGRYGALTMIADYAHRQLPIDYNTWKIVAAESSFGRNREVCIGETERIVLYWMGQPDLFVVSGNRIFPVDHKSVGYIDANTERKYKPNIQLPGYIIAGQILCKSLGMDLPIDKCIINCVARSDRTDKTGESKYPRFKRITVPFSVPELEEWKKRRLDQAERMRFCFENNVWAWNEATCFNWFWKVCPFLNIDSKPPAIRPVIIGADYVTRAHWIPGRSEKDEEKKGEQE